MSLKGTKKTDLSLSQTHTHTHTHRHICTHTLSQTQTHIQNSHGHAHYVQDTSTDGTLTVLSSLNNQPLCARENVMFLVDICAATMSLLIKMSTSSSRSRSLSYRERKCSPYSFQVHGTELRRRRKKVTMKTNGGPPKKM